MNKTQLLLLVILTLISSATAHSQVDRSMQQSYSKPKKNNEKVDYVQLSVDQLSKELTLDGFQSAVVKDMILASQKEQLQVVNEDIPNPSKAEKLKVLQERCIEKIKTILNPEQVKQYEAMINKQKKNKR